MFHHTITFRVRYPEVDAMGYVHHSRYLQYFELGRVEMLRAAGVNYSDLEQKGVYFVVTKAEIRFKAPRNMTRNSRSSPGSFGPRTCGLITPMS